MTNPFLNMSARFLSDPIKEQISKMSIGESAMIDFQDADISKSRLRALVFYAASALEVKVKTKSDEGGNLWVMRIN